MQGWPPDCRDDVRVSQDCRIDGISQDCRDDVRVSKPPDSDVQLRFTGEDDSVTVSQDDVVVVVASVVAVVEGDVDVYDVNDFFEDDVVCDVVQEATDDVSVV